MTPITCPFTILFDHRERQGGYTFQGLHADSDKGGAPLIVPIREVHLETGDYSVDGWEELVTIERKTKADFYSSVSNWRDRFWAEHVRMAAMRFAAVVVESSLPNVAMWPPINPLTGKAVGMSPRAACRTALAWEVQHGIHWHFIHGRRGAEIITFHLLRFFWEQTQRSVKNVA